MNRNKKVLVISDGRQQFALAASLLRAEGYKVHFTNDMHQGLEFADAELPNLIVSELATPGIDGLKICKSFRRNDRMRATPILLVGDLSKNSPIVRDGRRCGANDYVQRPFTFDVLAGKVMELSGSLSAVVS